MSSAKLDLREGENSTLWLTKIQILPDLCLHSECLHHRETELLLLMFSSVEVQFDGWAFFLSNTIITSCLVIGLRFKTVLVDAVIICSFLFVEKTRL